MIGRHTCKLCKNFISGNRFSDEKGCQCKAFPDKIPYETYAFIRNWDAPKNCNNGIGFEPNEEVAENLRKAEMEKSK